MGTILQKILLLIVLTLFFGAVVYAEENSVSKVSKIEDDFGYNKVVVSQQKPAIQEDTEYDQTSKERMMIMEYQQEQRKLLAEANMQNVKIVASLYAFSLIIIIILMKITDHHAKDIVTIVGLVSVIFGTLLLVLMIGDTEQMTAPIGIFGAIAGYLFGYLF